MLLDLIFCDLLFHLCRLASAIITVVAFLLGAVCSGVAGYVGMWVSVRANVRVSSAARRSAREALQVPCCSYFIFNDLITPDFSFLFVFSEYRLLFGLVGSQPLLLLVWL